MASMLTLTACPFDVSIKELDSAATFPIIYIQDVSVTEGATAAFTISLSKPATGTVKLLAQTNPDSAASGMDYLPLLGLFTISPGQSSLVLYVPTLEDPNYEGAEVFDIELTAVTNAVMGAGLQSRSVTIVDNESIPKIYVSDATVAEGGTLSFTVTLDVPAEVPVAFDFATVAGLATAGSDYTPVSGRFTFAAYATSTTLDVVSLQDLLNEATETLTFETSGFLNADSGDVNGDGTITDDDVAPTLSISDLSINEGETGFMAVSLSALSGQEVVFTLTTIDDTAISPTDYTAVGPKTFTIAAGAPEVLVALESVEDFIDEIDETFAVTLSAVTNATPGTLGATVTIVDDDSSPDIFVTDATVVEGGTLAFVVSLSVTSGLAVTFNFQTFDGSATIADLDYTAAAGVGTVSPGSLSITVMVPSTVDSRYELDEALTFSLSAIANAGVGDDEATGTITDDDPQPTLTIFDLAVNEGDTGFFVASLSAVSGLDVVFTWETANGANGDPLLNALAPADYLAVPATVVTISAGSWTFNLPVVTIEDGLDELDEGLSMAATAVTGATPGALGANGVILDDDAPVGIFISDLTLSEGATGDLYVTLSAASGLDVSFTWATQNGTGLAPADYDQVAVIGVTIPAGATSVSLTVVANQDLLFEGSENFMVTLAAAGNATFVDSMGVVTIIDDDGPPQILIGDAVITEAGTLDFLVTLTEVSGLDVHFDFATADATATTGESDYVGIGWTRITIPAGSLSVTVSVVTLPDLLDEDDETLLVSLASETNAVILDGQGVGTITDDDAMPNLFVGDSTVTEGETLSFSVSLSVVSGRDVIFTRATADFTALAPADYAALNASILTIPKGSLAVMVEVLTVQESLHEPAEAVHLDVSAIANATGVIVQGLGTILNDDAEPEIFISDSLVTEGATMPFTVTLSAVSGVDVTFDLSTSAGSATATDDYGSVALSNITIPAGSLSFSFGVITVQDLLDENNEVFSVSLANLVGATVGDDLGLGTINDDDLGPELFVTDAAAVTEGGTALFVISLSAPSGLDVTFNFFTQDDSAVDTQDYTQLPVTATTISAGVLAITVPVVTVDDARDEVATEYFTLTITAAVNASISDPSGDGAITDNDNPPEIFITDASVTEGGTFAFEISLSAMSDLDVDFNYESYDGSGADLAVEPADYGAISGSNQITAGAITLTLNLASVQDVIDEVDEKLALSLSALVNATAGRDLAEGLILDDDATPVLAIYDLTVTEGMTAQVLVSLSHPSSRDITFEWSTADNTALAPADYTARLAVTTTIGAGALTLTLPVVTTEDLAQEPTQDFRVTLSNPVNASGTPTGVVTITDDDLAPDIFITDHAVTEGGTLEFVVSIAEYSGFDIVFGFQSYDGVATVADGDFANLTGTATIAAGNLSVTLSLPTIDDSRFETNEVLTVSLSGVTNAGVGDDLATGTINNDDLAPGLYVSDHSVLEGETLVFAISLDAISGLDTVVTWGTVDGTATVADSDYTAVAGAIVTIPAGLISIAAAVETVEDTVYEADEILAITLTAPVNATVVDGHGVGTIVNDDVAPEITVYDLSINEGETGNFVASLSAQSALDVEFTWRTYDGSAGVADFTAVAPTVVTLAAGQWTIALPVVTTHEFLDEPDETFLVSLASPVGASFADDLATGTIIDDDVTPEIFLVDAASVTEGGTSLFLVTISEISGLAITFDYQSVDGTAMSIQDYTQVATTTGTIPAGSLSYTFTVITVDDDRDEVSPENFTVTITGATSATIGDGSGIADILDNDDPPAIFVADASAGEGATLEFLVTVSTLSDLDVTFDYWSLDGTALAPGDYGAVSVVSATIPAGSFSLLVNVVAAQDTLYEPAESLAVTLANLQNVTAGDTSAGGVITDDDSPPAISVYDLSILEGDTGLFVASLSAVSGLDAIFSWGTYYLTASALDFTAVGSSVVTIPAGSTSVILEVVTTEDVLSEANETFEVSLAAPVDATFADDLAIGTITDDDGLPLLYISDAADVTEGSTSDFIVTLSAVAGQDVSFTYQSYDDTAVFTQDYTQVSATVVTIPAGSLTVVISPVTLDDARDEVSTEYYVISLSSAVNANVATPSGRGGILDNDSPPVLYITDAAVTEGGTMAFLISISDVSDLDVDFNYESLDGSDSDKAEAPGDYSALAVTAGQIPAGSLSLLVNVTSVQDVLFEVDEKFTVTLTGLVNASGGDIAGTGTILDDDVAPQISVFDLTITEGETGYFVASLSAVSALDAIFDWRTYDGTAAALDFTGVGLTTVTIAAGQMTLALPVITTEDLIDEPDETFEVSLASAQNASFADDLALGTISDNDAGPELFIVDSPAVTEGDTSAFLVTLSMASGLEITFTYQTLDGTAVSSQDYTAVGATVGTIPAGGLSFMINVVSTDDVVDEASPENYTVSLTSATNATVNDGSGAGDIVDNDDPPQIFVSDSSETEGETLFFNVSLSTLSDLDVTFAYWSMDGSDSDQAVAPADYGSVSVASVTIPAGSLSLQISVVSAQETLFEVDEKFSVTLASLVNVTAGDVSGEGTIVNDDTAPQISVFDLSISEGETGYFTVSLSAVSSLEVVFDWMTYIGTADGADFTGVGLTTVTVAAGQMTLTLPVVTAEDVVDEPNENFAVSLSSALNASFADDLAAGTIVDDDAGPELFIVDSVSVTEGETSAFLVTLSMISGLEITFNFETVDGTAVSTQDYASVASTVGTIPAGSLSFMIHVVTTDDVVDEASPETYTVSLTSATNATVNDGSGAGDIVDNDSPPQIFISDSSANEGGTLSFIVSISAVSDLNVSFSYWSQDGLGSDSALAPGDYGAVSVASATIPAGSLSTAISVASVQEALYEVDEVFSVTLASLVNVTTGDVSGEGTILNDDTAPQISVYDLSINEGETGQFVASLSAVSSLDAVFEWQTFTGTALAPDFTFVGATTVTIVAGQMTLDLPVLTTEDLVDEPDETFLVSLAAAVGATFADDLAVGTIVDDDLGPELFVADAADVVEGGTSVFVVSLSALSGLDVTFTYESVDGTAVFTQDYVQTSAAIGTIPAGNLSLVLNVTTTGGIL